MRRVVLCTAALLLLCTLLIIYSCLTPFYENAESSLNPSRTRTVPLKLSKSSHIDLLYPLKLLGFLQKNALFVSAAGLVLVLFIVLAVYFVYSRHSKKDKDIILEDIVEEQEEELDMVDSILSYRWVLSLVLLVLISFLIYRLYLCRAPQDPFGLKFVNEEWYVPIPDALDELMKEILKRPDDELVFSGNLANDTNLRVGKLRLLYTPFERAYNDTDLVYYWLRVYDEKIGDSKTFLNGDFLLNIQLHKYKPWILPKTKHENLDVLSKDLMFFWVSERDHSSIIVVDHRTKVDDHYLIIHYDSLGMHSEDYGEMARKIMDLNANKCGERTHEKITCKNCAKYMVKHVTTPRQYNAADCVIFAAAFAFFYLNTSYTYENMPFTHADIAYFRRRFTALNLVLDLKKFLDTPENCRLFSDYPIDQLVHYFNFFIHFERPEEVQYIVSKLEISDVEKIKNILEQSTDRNKLINLLSYNRDMLAIAERVLPQV